MASMRIHYRDTNDTQRALLDRISEISQASYCAGWMMGIEYSLWALAVGDRQVNDTDLAFEHETAKPELLAAELHAIAAEANGWGVWEGENEFVSLDEWLGMYAAHKAAARS